MTWDEVTFSFQNSFETFSFSHHLSYYDIEELMDYQESSDAHYRRYMQWRSSFDLNMAATFYADNSDQNPMEFEPPRRHDHQYFAGQPMESQNLNTHTTSNRILSSNMMVNISNTLYDNPWCMTPRVRRLIESFNRENSRRYSSYQMDVNVSIRAVTTESKEVQVSSPHSKL